MKRKRSSQGITKGVKGVPNLPSFLVAVNSKDHTDSGRSGNFIPCLLDQIAEAQSVPYAAKTPWTTKGFAHAQCSLIYLDLVSGSKPS